jgi:hypothetical protein
MSGARGWETVAPRRTAKAPTDRRFGSTIAAVLSFYAAYSYLHAGRVRIVVIVAAAAIGALAVLRPRALHGANVAWQWLGRWLERIVNPVVLGVLFLVVITPMALLMRLVGRDPLRRRIDRAATTYWIRREDPPTADSWPHQF